MGFTAYLLSLRNIGKQIHNPVEGVDTDSQCATRALERTGREKILLCPRAMLTVGPCLQTGAFATSSGLRSQLGLASGQSCGSGRHRFPVRYPARWRKLRIQ